MSATRTPLYFAIKSAAYSSHLKSPSGHVQVTVKKKLGYPVAYCISRRWQKMSRHNKERTQEVCIQSYRGQCCENFYKIDEYSRCFNNLRSPRSRQCLKTLPSQSTRTRTPQYFKCSRTNCSAQQWLPRLARHLHRYQHPFAQQER